MATVYAFVGGKKLTKIIATNDGVQDALDKGVGRMAARARTELAAHKHDGHSRIETAKGDVDRYLILSDERGQKAAMSIEFGREPNPDTGKGGMQGLFVLHHAARKL